MSGRTFAAVAGALAAIALGGFLYYVLVSLPAAERAEEERRAAAEARAQDAEAAREAQLQSESRRLLPEPLRGVWIGMPTAALTGLRTGAARQPGTPDPQAQHLVTYSETLPNGARVVYQVDEEGDRLERVQMMSSLPAQAAIGPHLRAMNDKYGTPTGIWDCQTEQLPNRRFTWRGGRLTIADIFLLHGSQVSVTLYVAPNGVLTESLRRSRCQPVTMENVGAFPALAAPTPTRPGPGLRAPTPPPPAP